MRAASVWRGKVGIVQRVLTDYRRPFFERLAETPGLTISVCAGQPMDGEAIRTANHLNVAHLWSPTNRYLKAPLGLVCWQSGLLTWLRRVKPDALILEANPRLLSNWPAIWWMKRQHKPVLGWGLGQLQRFGPRLMRTGRAMAARHLICSLDGLLAYSSKAARDYVGAGAAPDRVFIAYNAIDNGESDSYLKQFASDRGWVMTWKESLGFDPMLPMILFVGRLIPQKAVDLLIEASVPLLDRCQLLIVGDGPSRSQLESRALPHGTKVRFVGHQTGAALAKSFIAADIFVLPGLGGLAVHQAMSYGKPVLVSFGDGTEEDLVREGQNGMQVPPGDPIELRRRLAYLLSHPQLIRTMGQASLSIVRNEVSLEAMVASFNRALRHVTQVEKGAG